MSQRNPMNERYTSEERTGVTRKSAASAKPKSKAAASVTVKSAKKTPEQRKAAEKAARKEAAAKQREVERKYYKPDTPRYKRLRAIWWVMLIAAIGCTTLSFVGQGALPQWLSVTTLIAAYVFIIGAFVLDFWKIKKERVAYATFSLIPILWLAIYAIRSNNFFADFNCIKIEHIVITVCRKPNIFHSVFPICLCATPFFSLPCDSISHMKEFT